MGTSIAAVHRAPARHALLMTFFYPPVATPRAIRWYNLSRRLVDHGWDLTVITARHSPGYPQTASGYWPGDDQDTIRTFPGLLYTAVYGRGRTARNKAQPEAGNSARGGHRFANWARSCYRCLLVPLLIPDRHAEWVPVGWRAARAALARRRYDAVVTSGYPFSTHFIGRALKRSHGLPWIADYGDPWGPSESTLLPRWRLRLDQGLERSLLRDADAIVVTTETTSQAYKAMYGARRQLPLWIVPQGFDETAYREPAARDPGTMLVTHTGIFYPQIREPLEVVRAVEMLGDSALRLALVGEVDPMVVASGLGGPKRASLLLPGHVNPLQAAEWQARSDVLVLICYRSGLQIPGKLYEYMGARRPILVVSESKENAAVQLVISRRRGLHVFPERDAIARALSQLLDLWRRGELDRAFDLSPMPEHGWNARARQMAAILGEVTTRAAEASRASEDPQR